MELPAKESNEGIYRVEAKQLADETAETQKFLCKALNRRSQKKSYTWDGFADMLKEYPLAKPKIYVRLF